MRCGAVRRVSLRFVARRGGASRGFSGSVAGEGPGRGDLTGLGSRFRIPGFGGPPGEVEPGRLIGAEQVPQPAPAGESFGRPGCGFDGGVVRAVGGGFDVVGLFRLRRSSVGILNSLWQNPRGVRPAIHPG